MVSVTKVSEDVFLLVASRCVDETKDRCSQDSYRRRRRRPSRGDRLGSVYFLFGHAERIPP